MNSGGGSSSSSGFGGLSNGESGILRKTIGIGHHNLLLHQHHHHHHHHHHNQYGQDNFADLLVFGYSCKIFRDDEKARFIDQGRHLIPWMGDNQLKIDRYDARGALHDLTQHEPPIGGYGNRVDCLPPAEQRAEQLCEDERYYSLYANEVEEEIYQEEAAKRLAANSAEVPFDYDAATSSTAAADGVSPVVGPVPAGSSLAADDENSSDPPFIAPANFDIPPDLTELPETMKEHAIIEKTAKFIASQDSQMEILLRAKQAANPQFDFLSPGGRLYRYYRHVLMAIKTNRYPEDVPDEESNGVEADASEDVESAISSEKPKLIIPTIKYKPSVDCAYTQLISKITGAPIPTKFPDESDPRMLPTASTDLTQVAAPNVDLNYPPEEKSVEVKHVPTGLAGLMQYDSDSEDMSADDVEEKTEQKKEPDPTVERREITFSGLLPPEIFQHVIEKTATYVAKNGYSFEDALRTKNDPRFLFLRKDHEFYPFYAFRVRYLIDPFEEVPKSPEPVTITREIENGTVVETPSIGIKTVNIAPQPVAPPPSQIQANKPGGAVCFSIKSKDDGTKSSKANVVQELGGNEEEPDPSTEKEKSKSPSPVSKDGEQLKENAPQTDNPPESDEARTPSPSKVAATQELVSSTTPPLDDAKSVAVTIPEDATKDLKRLEDRIKDKLAVAAREKLAMISKEKQLQLERKKRASMFISLISSKPEEQDPAPQVENSTVPMENEWENSPLLLFPSDQNGLEMLKNQFEDEGDNSSNISFHSIPSQSDSPASNQAQSSADDDVVLVEDDDTEADRNGRPSRSRTRSRSTSTGKHKRRKHKHKSKSKKSKKKKSKSPIPIRSPSKSKVKTKRKRASSRTPSKSPRRSRSRSYSEKEAKKSKKSKSKKSHKQHKSSRSSSSSRHHHHRKERRDRAER
ncbi:protein suppressor of white apricot [Malaya genurostris]|uniref:protein suppressor of white apricot n=1 Tax=Malaya genurostris TaxID=325434 RepID=UPI0026F3EC61|nr:protein suppressor of white apricot [Malaya genurostris]